MAVGRVRQPAIWVAVWALASVAPMAGAWASPAAAPTKNSASAAKPDAADELVRLVHAHTLSEQPTRMLSLYATKAAGDAAKANPTLTDKQKAMLAALPAQIGDLMKKQLKWDALLDAYAKIYRKVYSPAEINAQLNFYRSKEGAAILQKQGQLTNQIVAQTSSSLKPVYAALQKLIDDQIKTIVSPVSPAASAASS